jgi:biuret amidohydrolase
MVGIQDDFLEKGGLADSMGYVVTLLNDIVLQCRLFLYAVLLAGFFILHTREGYRPDQSDAAPAKLNRSHKKTFIGTPSPLGRVLVRGEKGHDIIPELNPLPGEPGVDMPGHGAFYATDLDLILRNKKIKNLVICGVVTEICVHSTVREAKDHGYACLVLEDGVGSYSSEFQQVGLEMIKTQSGLLGKVSNSKAFIRALNCTSYEFPPPGGLTSQHIYSKRIGCNSY